MAKPAELAAAFAICARSVKLDDLEIDILSRTVAVARNEDARQQPAMLSADRRRFMKAGELKGKAVVSMADGVQVGRVEDILFDTTALRVAALVLTTTGGRSILPFAAVRSLGADAVTVESATATQPAAAQGEAGNLLRALADLTGLKVVNGEGAYLGDVRDVTIEQATGALTELEAHHGGMLGMGGTTARVPASAIRGIGPELITVDMPAPTGDQATTS
jgi:sporulation protein YlmC with PRC-barrel domain